MSQHAGWRQSMPSLLHPGVQVADQTDGNVYNLWKYALMIMEAMVSTAHKEKALSYGRWFQQRTQRSSCHGAPVYHPDIESFKPGLRS